MNKVKHLVSLLLGMLVFFSAKAQNNPEMADAMRSDGKIYVVVAIILIVLIGLFVYLFILDKKVKKLENLLHEKHGQTK
jgi:CcmD family protein